MRLAEYLGRNDVAPEASFYIKARVNGQVYYERVPIYEYSNFPFGRVIPAPGVTGYTYGLELYVDGSGQLQQREVLKRAF